MKNWAILALTLALCPWIDSPRSVFAQASPKLRPLRIALPSHSVSSSPVYIAKSLGIFERYGFDTQILVLEPRAALAALLTGDLDFYTAAGTTGRAALRTVPVRVVMVAMNRSDQVVVAAKEFTSVEQLRGKTLGGYTAQASANIILIEMLRRKGLKPEDYKILNIGTNRASALLSGQIAAAVLTAVEAARLTRQGFRVLARASDDIESSSGGLGTAMASLQNKRDIMRFHLAPVPVAQRDEPFRRANQVDEEHRRQHPPRREAWSRAPVCIQRLERREVGRQIRDDELEDAFGTGKAIEAMRAEVPQAQTTD